MKKGLLIMLALALSLTLAAAAFAAPMTRTETINMEGIEEQIVVTCFESPLGYTLWYDAMYLAPSSSDGVDTFAPPHPEASASVAMTIERVTTTDTPQQLAQAALSTMRGGEGEVYDASAEFKNLSAQAMYYFDDAMSTDVLFVDTPSGIIKIKMVCPIEAAEGYGNRMWDSLMSFEITA